MCMAYGRFRIMIDQRTRLGWFWVRVAMVFLI